MGLTEFMSSNLLRFDRPIDYRIDLPLGLPSRFGSTEPNFFIEKQDSLGFKLDLGTINLLLEGVMVYFEGSVINEDDGIIRWRINNSHLSIEEMPIGRSVSGFRISQINGELTSRISDITPDVDSSNAFGGNRLYRTMISFIGDQNILNIQVNDSPILWGSVHILSAAGRCGGAVPTFRFDVTINYNNWVQDGCGHKYLMLDEPVTFTAGISNVRGALGMPQSTKYYWEISVQNDEGEWEVIYNTGPSENPRCPYLPDQTGLVKIKAIVDITTDSTEIMENGLSSFELQMIVQNEETLNFARAICELTRNIAGFHSIVVRGVGAGFTVGGIRFIDPLWDPTPDIFRKLFDFSHPYSLQHLQQIQSNMQRTAKYASQIVSASSKLIEKQKMKTVASIEKQLKLAKNNGTAIDLKKDNTSALSLSTSKK